MHSRLLEIKSDRFYQLSKIEFDVSPKFNPWTIAISNVIRDAKSDFELAGSKQLVKKMNNEIEPEAHFTGKEAVYLVDHWIIEIEGSSQNKGASHE